jgi:NitT/TauT family transport system substrate-binding protein
MRKRAIWAGLVLLAAGSVCQAQPRQTEKVELAIGYIPHIQFAPLYVGIEKGFYAEEGIDLRIQYGFGIDIFSLLAARRIDIGLSDSDQVILAGVKGLALKAVFQYYQTYPVTVVAKSARIRTPADLAGRRIGTPELYGTSWIGLQLFLEKYGLQKTATVEKIGYTQLTTLLADKIDAAVCFLNNEPVQLREMGQAIRQWDVKDSSDMVGAAFISSTETIRNRRAILVGFARASARALEYTVTNQDEAFALSLRHLGNVDPARHAFMRKSLAATCRLFESPAGWGNLDEAVYARSIETLARLGLIAKRIPAAEIIERLK